MQRRSRLILIAAAVVLVLLIGAALLTVHLLLKPDRFAAMLQGVAADAGLVLRMDGPAEPQLWPRPAVRMRGLRLSLPGAGAPLLTAAQARLVVPWHSLLGGAPAIDQLQLQSPRIDLAQLRVLLRQHATAQQTGAPTLPTIGAGVQIRDGKLFDGNDLLLAGVDLITGPFAGDQRFNLDFAARMAKGREIAARFQAVPHQDHGVLRLDELTLDLDSADASLHLSGTLAWHGGARFNGEMHGTLQLVAANYQLHWAMPPASAGTPAPMRIALDNADTHVTLALSLAQAVAWWRGFHGGAAAGLSLPPVRGQIDAASLDIGSMHIVGLHIDSGAPAAVSAAPATASSAMPAPATSR